MAERGSSLSAGSERADRLLQLEMARGAFLAMLAGIAGGSVAACDFSFVLSSRWAPTPLPASGRAATASPPARSYRMQPPPRRMSRTWRELTMMWNPFGERHGAGDSEWDPSEPVLSAGQVGGLAAQEMFRRSEAGGKESELKAARAAVKATTYSYRSLPALAPCPVRPSPILTRTLYCTGRTIRFR